MSSDRLATLAASALILTLVLGFGAEAGSVPPDRNASEAEVPAATLPSPGDFNQWRGSRRNGHVERVTVPATLPPALRELWAVEVGAGYSTPVVGGELVFVLTREGSAEVVRALRLKDGKLVWRQRYPAPYEPAADAQRHGQGPKSTPLLHDGRLYTFGISGILSCYRAADGTLLWRQSFASEFGSAAPEFGAAASPVIDGDLLFLHVGGRGRGALRAFDRTTGATRWSWGGDGPAYASPIVATLAGVRQLVTLSQRQLVGLAVDDGTLLWNLPFETPYEQNVVTPLVVGDLLIVSGLEQGTTALRLQGVAGAIRPTTVWKNDQIWMYMSSPVAMSGALFGMSNRQRGQLFCLDSATGRTRWLGPAGFGDNAALVVTDTLLWALADGGRLIAYRTDPKAFHLLADYAVGASQTWAHPVFVDTSVLVKDDLTLRRYAF